MNSIKILQFFVVSIQGFLVLMNDKKVKVRFHQKTCFTDFRKLYTKSLLNYNDCSDSISLLFCLSTL